MLLDPHPFHRWRSAGLIAAKCWRRRCCRRCRGRSTSRAVPPAATTPGAARWEPETISPGHAGPPARRRSSGCCARSRISCGATRWRQRQELPSRPAATRPRCARRDHRPPTPRPPCAHAATTPRAGAIRRHRLLRRHRERREREWADRSDRCRTPRMPMLSRRNARSRAFGTMR